jgi:hypothetical protein
MSHHLVHSIYGYIGLVAMLASESSRDDQDFGFSFQQDFLPPTHLHEFYFMIDYTYFYANDYYVIDLYLLFHMIKHMGKYLRLMIRWLDWLYDFT